MRIGFVPPEYKASIETILGYSFARLDAEATVGDLLPENSLGCFDGDTLASFVYIVPHEMYYHGKIVKLGGIGLVSTLPEYRGKGCSSALLVKSLEVMKERGYAFSALAPFSYAFYRNCGWEMGFSLKKYTIPIERLRSLGTGQGQLRPLTLGDTGSINSLYEGYISQYNGGVRRDESNWTGRLRRLGENRSYGYVYSRDGAKLNGYILYSMSDMTINIQELIYDSLEAKLEIFRFIYSHSSQADEVIWEAPMDDNTVLLLDEPDITQAIEAFMMVRAVDVRQALASYAYPQGYAGSFIIKVKDEHGSWNNKCFNVVVRHGAAQIETADPSLVDLEMDIQTFSQLAMGYIGLNEAVELEKAKIYSSKLDDLQAIFQKRATYLRDYF